MKIKFTLVLAIIFTHAVLAAAQLPTRFSTGAESAKDGLTTINQILQNTENKFNIVAATKNSAFTNQPPLNNLSSKCGDSKIQFAPEAAPCNGVSVTSINFNNANRTIVSGTANTVGVVYKYANAGTAPDGTSVDAYVKVISYSNNQDTNQTNFSDADTPSSTAGYDQNLQPDINQESGTFASSTPWNGSIQYQINFYAAGTTTPKVLTVAAISIDNDGGAICGNLHESISYSAGLNQILINTPSNTTQVISGNTVAGPTTNQANIGIGNTYANAALFVNVSQLNWTYSFTTSGNCTAGNASAARYGSLNMSCQVTFDRNFASVALSGNVYNDTNGLTDSAVNGIGIGQPSGTQLYANLLDSNNYVVSSVTVAANGTYTFPTAFSGSYNIQITKNQGVESSLAPATALPSGWVNTGENLGSGTGNDTIVNGLLPVTIGTAAITNANFGIEQCPVASNNTAASQINPGGTLDATVPATTFAATDTGTVSSIRIMSFPSNATSITINGTKYTSANFPVGGVTIPTNTSGNPTQTILVDPFDGAVTVGIQYVAVDNAGVASTTTATASVPFTLSPTAANADISGKLRFAGNPIGNALVVLIDAQSNSRAFTRTDADGNYLFADKTVGKTYIVQPLSSKYSFGAANNVVNLLDNATNINFDSTAKKYHAKNDFDGDGKSDLAVFRPSDGNWYVLRSSDNQMSVFNFGVSTDIPVSADFDGDGKNDYAVFRPSEGNWYIWQSKTQDLRVENFGLAGDKLVPADYDGDGKADIAVYRNGNWYIRQSSDGTFKARNFGLETDTPIAEDFDGDGRADLSVYRSTEGMWYSLRSSNESFSAQNFGLATDVPVAGDFDGDGFADIAQFRNGNWYILNSTTAFEASQFGSGKDKSIVGDFDGDGRADQAVYRNGLWLIRNSGDRTVRQVYFGLSSDILVK